MEDPYGHHEQGGPEVAELQHGGNVEFIDRHLHHVQSGHEQRNDLGVGPIYPDFFTVGRVTIDLEPNIHEEVSKRTKGKEINQRIFPFQLK